MYPTLHLDDKHTDKILILNRAHIFDQGIIEVHPAHDVAVEAIGGVVSAVVCHNGLELVLHLRGGGVVRVERLIAWGMCTHVCLCACVWFISVYVWYIGVCCTQTLQSRMHKSKKYQGHTWGGQRSHTSVVLIVVPMLFTTLVI